MSQHTNTEQSVCAFTATPTAIHRFRRALIYAEALAHSTAATAETQGAPRTKAKIEEYAWWLGWGLGRIRYERDTRIAEARREVATRALWEILLLTGADVSDFTYETRTPEGREAGYREFMNRGSAEEVIDAVRELRTAHDHEE